VPTTRRRRRRSRKVALSSTARAYLWDQPLPTNYDDQEFYNLRYHEWYVEPLWKEYREWVLADRLETNPGTRPHLWWEYDAPRQKGVMQGRELPCEVAIPRKRLGGIGTPAFEVLAFKPYYRYGVPAIWMWESMIESCNRSKDGRFWGEIIDPDDPPFYASEADYLKFHELFLPGEEQRLTKENYTCESLSGRHFLTSIRVQQSDKPTANQHPVKSSS
jgi:hypothetical protein